ncbi:hypothetical protein G8O24_21465 [Bradyrhizobium sp. INPA01-394B]|uniref:Uncharacterized protein n=1 Tax=Bradyrhizobium campsiandrae TaxID=1729892 RepID=A0ABR7U4U6_9BRAD|nr:hypothetical protein [Bradyrhizobium campsiandrae]MBC9879913.1 hypothetical protein [Bradyrhizobium campsiandrae]MBC9978598.1 hypothetical protein [Bradyrhizobium campsiandrae]
MAAFVELRSRIHTAANLAAAYGLGATVQSVRLASLPIVAQAAIHGVVHLVTRMLGELDVDGRLVETDDLDTRFYQLTRQLCAGFFLASLPNIAHEEGHRSGIIRTATPEASLAKFPDRDADAIDVRLHHVRVDLAHALGEVALLVD